MTKVLPCRCRHEYQDAEYGRGQRVHNHAPRPKSAPVWRCTVCTSEKTE